MSDVQTETVADVFAEIVDQAIGGDSIPRPIRIAIRPYIGRATEAMASNPDRTRELLLAWLPRLCRASGIASTDLD